MLKFSGGGFGGGSVSNKPDTYFTDDVVEVILGISEGPIKGLKDNSPKNFYIGETPLINSSGTANFSDFDLSVHKGSSLGELIVPRLGGQSTSLTVNTKLAQHTPINRQCSQVDIDWLELRFLIHTLVSNTEEGTRARSLEIGVEYKPSNSNTWLSGVLYANSGTTIETQGNTLRIIHSGDIQAATSTCRQQVIYNQQAKPSPTVAERNLGDVYGHRVWWIQGNYIPKFYSSGEFFTPDGLLVDETRGHQSAEFEDKNYIALIDPSRGDFKRKIFFWTEGTPNNPRIGDLWYNPNQGRTLWFNGSAWVETLGLEGRYDPNAGHNVVSTNGTLRINEKITSNAVREVKIKVDRIGVPYDVRVTKLTADSSENDQTDVSLESIQEVRAEPMRFPNLATVHLVGRASDQFSSLPQFAGVYEGREVKVPSNYDPVARTYQGDWDGTWKVAYSNNPAYVGYDLVENDVYGMSATYPVVLDPFDVYDAGKWCDKRLPNGRPQFTFNQVIQECQSPRELATYIFGIFGGRFFDYGNGYARLRIDNNDFSPAHLFAKENVKEGTFKYSYTEIETRINDYTVAFKNPDLFYKEDRRRVRDQQSIDTYGRVSDDFIAVGCNNADEAVYRATVKLLSDQTEVETVTFETAREGLYLEPYDVILVADDTMNEFITGRIAGTEGSRTIYLRDHIFLETGFDHKITINLNDFEVAVLNIAPSSTGKPTKILTLSQDLPEVGVPTQAVFTVNQNAKPYRVLAIGEGEGEDDESIVISAIEVNRTKYAVAAESPGSPSIEIPQFETDLSPVSNARITPWQEIRQGRAIQNLSVQWDAHPNKFVRNYRVASRFNDDEWVFHGEVREPRIDLFDVEQGRHLVSIQAIALTGQKSVTAYVDIDLTGAVRLVATPRNLTLVNKSGVDGNLQLFDDMYAEIQWEPGEIDVALLNYRVDVFNIREELLHSTFVGVPSFTLTQTIMRHSAATRQLRVVVTAYDRFGNQSSPTAIQIKNPAPPAPLVAVGRGFGSIQIGWPISTIRDYAGALVWIADAPGINPAKRDPDYDITANELTIPTESGMARYARVAIYDTLGKTELNYSQEVYAQSYMTVDTVPPQKPTGLTLESYIETINGVVQRQMLVAALNAPTDSDFAYFDFEVKQNEGNWVSFTSSTPRREWSVLPKQKYTVRVSACDQFGNRSGFSETKSLTTPECPELAHLINSGHVAIEAGKVSVYGATLLSDWRKGGDDSHIDGNMLSTGTVTAEKAVFGQRAISVDNIEFEHNKPALNTLSWSSGTIRYPGDDGNTAVRNISAGSAAWTNGTLFICYKKGATVLTATTDTTVAFDDNAVVLASYRGDRHLVTDYGRTIIDGGHLKTGTVIADQARINSIDTDAIQTDAIRSRHLVSDLIETRHLKAKIVTADKMDVRELSAITGTIGTFQSAPSGARTVISSSLILVYDANNVERVRLGVW